MLVGGEGGGGEGGGGEGGGAPPRLVTAPNAIPPPTRSDTIAICHRLKYHGFAWPGRGAAANSLRFGCSLVRPLSLLLSDKAIIGRLL